MTDDAEKYSPELLFEFYDEFVVKNIVLCYVITEKFPPIEILNEFRNFTNHIARAYNKSSQNIAGEKE